MDTNYYVLEYSRTAGILNLVREILEEVFEGMHLCMVLRQKHLARQELFDPKLMQLNFDPGVENQIFVKKYLRKLGTVKRTSSGQYAPNSPS
jgi:hypothetical protein